MPTNHQTNITDILGTPVPTSVTYLSSYVRYKRIRLVNDKCCGLSTVISRCWIWFQNKHFNYVSIDSIWNQNGVHLLIYN